MELERMVGRPPTSGQLTDDQIAQQSTWTAVPEDGRIDASMHVIHIVPSNGSTETIVNPTDPGDECYLERPYPPERTCPAGRMRY